MKCCQMACRELRKWDNLLIFKQLPRYRCYHNSENLFDSNVVPRELHSKAEYLMYSRWSTTKTHTPDQQQEYEVGCTRHGSSRSVWVLNYYDTNSMFQTYVVSSSLLRSDNDVIVKPSDVVVWIHPFDHRNRSRICVVFRFWHVAGFRRYFFLLSGSMKTWSTPTTYNTLNNIVMRDYSNFPIVRNIASILCDQSPNNSTPADASSEAKSIGRLLNGELYFIYRFALFSDGFNPSRSRTNTSANGVYIKCLNFPAVHLASQSTVRTLCIAPPGLLAASVFDAISDDLIEGSTAGFTDVDAEGNRRTIFLDLTYVLGDTPALNASLDVRGHTAVAPCHVCKLSRESNGSTNARYAFSYNSSSYTAIRRTSAKHEALRKCNPTYKALQYVGVKENPSEVHQVLFAIASKLHSISTNNPLTSESVPLLPLTFDPYGMSFITPDRLLTGLFLNYLEFSIFCLGTGQLPV